VWPHQSQKMTWLGPLVTISPGFDRLNLVHSHSKTWQGQREGFKGIQIRQEDVERDENYTERHDDNTEIHGRVNAKAWKEMGGEVT
jgi:hypothetical protein